MRQDPVLAAAEGLLLAHLLGKAGGHSSTIERWLDELPADETLLIRLRYVEGRPWALVARELHISERAVYDIRARVLSLLAYVLGIVKEG